MHCGTRICCSAYSFFSCKQVPVDNDKYVRHNNACVTLADLPLGVPCEQELVAEVAAEEQQYRQHLMYHDQHAGR